MVISFPDCPEELRGKCRTTFKITSNSDISGLGVVIGFVGTGYMVLALLLLNYLIAFDPSVPPRDTSSSAIDLQNDGLPTSRSNSDIDAETARRKWKPSIVDKGFLDRTRRVAKKVLGLCGLRALIVDPARSTHVQDCFNKCIIGLCDLQIVTGISILVSGFVSLNGDLSIFHWEIIVNLAWFSCVTHLSGLVTLRTYFQQHRWKRRVRISLMTALLVALLVARIPTGFMAYFLKSNPAICLFDIRCSDMTARTIWDYRYEFQTMLFSVILLVFGFVSRSVKLSARLSSRMQHSIREPFRKLSRRFFKYLASIDSKMDGECSQRELRRSAIAWLWRQFLLNPVIAAYLTAHYQFYLFNSMLAELYWLAVLLFWGTFQLKTCLDTEHHWRKDPEGSDFEMPFGQILPVLLLSAPLVPMGDIFFSEPSAGHPSQHLPQLNQFDSETSATSATNDALRNIEEINTSPPDLLNPDTRLVDEQRIRGSNMHALPRTTQVDATDLQDPEVRPSSNDFTGVADSGRSQILTCILFHDDRRPATWIGLCISVNCLAIIALTFAFFGRMIADVRINGFKMTASEMDATGFWLEEPGAIYFVLFGYSSALICNFLCGITMGQWLERSRSTGWGDVLWKRILFLIFNLSVWVSYLPMFWYEETGDEENPVVYLSMKKVLLSCTFGWFGFNLLVSLALSFGNWIVKKKSTR